MGWLWETLRWTDVLDIGLMASILYWTLLLIRGTRAIQSAAGMGVLVGLYVVADRLDLVTIHWMLEKFFVYLVLAVIILFQQDIRKGLARAGGQLWLVSGRTSLELSTVEELVRASYAMASRHMGALIAIERSGTLEEFVDPATKLDAQVSEPLLLSIFHPTSPLHDGAVVLQKGRVSAAQVFLPLTRSKNVSRFFGTRHRAAIGLSEETNALIIIVSEERATVSVVEGGKIHPTRDANELREVLQQRLQVVDSKPGAAAPAGS